MDNFEFSKLAMNEPKRANIFKIKSPDYKPWTLRDVVEHFSDKPYEQVVKEQKEKRK